MPAPKGHEPYAGCETGGRPTKYTKEFIEAEADAFDEWMKKKDSIWYKDFAYERGYDIGLIYDWARTNEKFSQAYKRSQLRQESLLVRGGLLKKFNYNMCALVLGHKYGMVAKQENKISGDAKDPLSVIMTVVNDDSRDLIDNAE